MTIHLSIWLQWAGVWEWESHFPFTEIARHWIHIHLQDLIIHPLNTETFDFCRRKPDVMTIHAQQILTLLNNQQRAVVLKDEEKSSSGSYLGSLTCSAVGLKSERCHVNMVSRLLQHFVEVFSISCRDLISPVKALKQLWCNCNQLEQWSTQMLCFQSVCWLEILPFYSLLIAFTVHYGFCSFYSLLPLFFFFFYNSSLGFVCV